MATEQQLNQFVINKVENQYVYDYMVENGLVNDDELYIVEGDNKVTEEDLDTSLAEKINNANNAIHNHQNKSVIDSIKQTDIDNWNDANSKKHSHTNKSVLDSIDNTSVSNWNDANSKKHEHANKALLDSISQSVMDNWNNAYSQSHTHSNKSLLDTYTQSNANISDAVTKRHTHSNKSALDSITQEKITNWDGANAYTDEKIVELINGAPSTLDTLGKIAEAMKNNENVVSALNDAIGTKANASDLSSHTGNKSNPHNVTKSQIGLGSVENKSSATIRGEITKQNVTDALGYTPPTQDTTYSTGTSTQSGLTKLYSGTGTATDGTMTQKAISNSIQEVEMMFGKYNTNLSWNEDETVFTETWTYNGNSYKEVLTEVSDTQYTKQIFVNDVSVGTWTLTIDEINRTANTVYTAT